MITNLKIQRMTRYPKAKQFAELAGVSPSFYSRLENGLVRRPKPEIRRRIAELLGVDGKALFQG